MNGDRVSHGLWEASAPPAAKTYPLTERIAVDVAIIGGGYTGSSAALHLAEAGASVAVLEAFDIGFGVVSPNRRKFPPFPADDLAAPVHRW